MRRLTRDHIRYMAVMALDEIAETCGKAPAPKSLWLRVILGFLWLESGARPEKRWIFDDFWRSVTKPRTPVEHEQLIEDYVRGLGARSALDGICRELGWHRTATFEEEMRARRKTPIIAAAGTDPLRPNPEMPARAARNLHHFRCGNFSVGVVEVHRCEIIEQTTEKFDAAAKRV